MSSQFQLLRERRFAPFFWTQFLGAFNDNLFKFAFTVMVTFHGLAGEKLSAAAAVSAIAALFILPFLLFSATAGQIADKYEKRSLVLLVKNLEIFIMVVAACGFLWKNLALLLLCTFLMGLHSTLFGPVKYAYLPQQLSDRELTGGNAMVEMGTFVAILLGNVLGGVLAANPVAAPQSVALGCLGIALLGRFVSSFVISAAPVVPDLAIKWNPVRETWNTLKLASENVVVLRALMGVSWLWFFGATFLTQFPAFAKETLGGTEGVASLLLVLFSVGIGVGSLMCESLSRHRVELGLVPIGAIGMTVFAVDLFFSSRGFSHGTGVVTAANFFSQPGSWRLAFDLVLMSLFSGIFSVPLYALIQERSAPTHRARIFAASNIWGAIFMIASAGLSAVALSRGATIPMLFLMVALMHVAVAVYVFLLVPEYLSRFLAWVLSNVVYRLKVRGDDQIPATGPAIVVCNHPSYVDPVLIMGVSPRPITFVMYHTIFKESILGPVFRMAKAIPIAPQSEDPVAYAKAFEAADRVLADGGLVGIFPEGRVSLDGEVAPFKGGVMKMLETRPVPVIPMALKNMWGSFFSRVEGQPMAKPFRRGFFSRVGLVVGAPVPPADVTPEKLRDIVLALRGKFLK